MESNTEQPVVASRRGHPRGLYLLFVTEMWERFSYYGMRALFILYMTKALLFDKAYGAQIYGSYTGLVYLTPLIGGYIADRYWGNRKSIVVGGLVMAIGQLFMFLSGYFFENVSLATTLMLVGLTALILGNGFFKPNISTMVGQLYPKGDKRIDSAFTIFYMGINAGAFAAPWLCGLVGDTGHPADFKWGFLLACIGMLISVGVFVAYKDKYLLNPAGEEIGGKPKLKKVEPEAVEGEKKTSLSKKNIARWCAVWAALLVAFYFMLDKDLIGAFIFSLAIAMPGFIISDPSLTKIERNRIWVIYIVAFFVIFFWAAFEQAGASLTYFAEEQTNRSIFGLTIPTSAFQSVNAIAILVFAPLFVILWGFLNRRGMEPASPYKQSIGLFLLAVGYLIIAFGVKGLEPGLKVSMIWLLSLYTIHTFGELCLSPIGLSMVNKLAPVKFAALLMGVWFLSNAAANKFAGMLSGYYPEALIELAAVKDAETKYTLQLLPENFTSAETAKVEPLAKETVPFDKIVFSKIENQELRGQVRVELEKQQIENPKSFLGYEISNLYDFFMLFVFMAGAASVILFFLSKRLVKLMEGVV